MKVWRDGDVLRLKWQVAPEGSANLLLRLNGIDLGYVDASLGEFEIRDIDFSSDYELDLAWMNSDGELGEVRLMCRLGNRLSKLLVRWLWRKRKRLQVR